VSIGDTLAEARRRAGLTIAQVSTQTRIRETIIRGIERGDFSACGGDFYARGHIKSIARAVGLDPDQLLQEYDAAYGSPHAIRAAEVFEPSTPITLKEPRRRFNWSMAMIIALLAIAGFVAYHAVSSGHHRATPDAAALHTSSPKPSPRHSSASPRPAVYHSRLTVKLVAEDGPCWVQFTTPAGISITQDYVVAGQSMTWTFKHPVSMQLGNPGVVMLTVNGTKRLSPGAQVTSVTLSLHPVKQLAS
jgi:transcriptional regulator with XRE-family HTH domain